MKSPDWTTGGCKQGSKSTGVRRLFLILIKNNGDDLFNVRLFVLNMEQVRIKLQDSPDLKRNIIESGLSYVIHRKKLWLAPLVQGKWDRETIADVISKIVDVSNVLKYVDEENVRNPFKFIGHKPFMTMLNRGLEHALSKKVTYLKTKFTKGADEGVSKREVFISGTKVFKVDRLSGNILLCSGVFLKFIRLGTCNVGLSILPSATVRLPNLEVASGGYYNPFLYHSHKKLFSYVQRWVMHILPLTIMLSNKTLIFEPNNFLDVRETLEGQRRLDEWM